MQPEHGDGGHAVTDVVERAVKVVGHGDPLPLISVVGVVAVLLIQLGVYLADALLGEVLLGVHALEKLVEHRAIQYVHNGVAEHVDQQHARGIGAEQLLIPVRGHELHAYGLHLADLIVRGAEDQVARHGIAVEEVAELVDDAAVV